jgi:hypothetical protein
LSYSPNARPRANELRQDKDYQGILQAEVPNLVCPENRLQEQTPVCQQQKQQRSQISSSPFRRTVSSSALRSSRESESGDIESVS